MVSQALRLILAEWLRMGLQRRGMKQLTLARQSGVSRDTIYRILRAETDAEEHTLRKLSDALGLALPELSGTTPQEAPSSPAAARSLAGPTPEALAARLAFLRDQFRAYQQLGQLPSQEVLAEWIRLTADIKEQDDDD